MPSFKTLDEIGDLSGKTALVRVDFNVPVANEQVTDDSRLRASVPTILALREAGSKVALLSHFGRPKGTTNSDFSLSKVTPALSRLIGTKVEFASDCIGSSTRSAIDNLPDRGVILLENTRFHQGEESNDTSFATELASLADLFVNDAFSVAHRAAASNVAITKLLPSYAGLSMTSELEALDKALGSPERPVFGIVGGSKVSTKIDLLNNLVTKIEALAIGGGMANTFLLAQGYDLGNSLVEPSLTETALEIIANAEKHECKLLLPLDVIVSEQLASGIPYYSTSVATIGSTEMALDIGDSTTESWKRYLKQSKTVVWNGPVGAFETPPFGRGTSTLARYVAKLSRDQKITAVAGGGDTIAALNATSVTKDFTHVSTAGGAFLQWMEGKTLPAVAALSQKT